jgi:outer membrane protein assembly factor BamA
VKVRCQLLVGILLSSLLASAQHKAVPKELPPSAYKLVAVTVTGSERFNSQDVAVASGLEIGQTAHEDDFQQASRRLGDTGAFREVSFNFKYAAEGTKVEFQVKDADKFVPARFENLVWFSTKELQDQLHAAVSLFHGELPLSGALADQVSEALQTMLIQKNVQGSVDYTRAGPDNAVDAIVYTVSGAHIGLRTVEFPDADPALLPKLQAAAEKIQVREYSQSLLREQAHQYLLPVYLAQGYLKAEMGDPEPKVVETTEEHVIVDVSFAAKPGPQYTLSGLEIVGNKVFSTQTLRQLVHAPVNEPANVVQLKYDLETIENLYGTKGYMAAKINSEHQMDDAQHTMACRITIVEGDVYKMGELDFHGVDSETRARLENLWTIHKGETYDSSYPAQFEEKAYKQIGALKNATADTHESPNPQDQTVDVTIRFDPKQ